MSDLVIMVIAVSISLALVTRSFWRQLLEVGILIVLFVFFVGILTLLNGGRGMFGS